MLNLNVHFLPSSLNSRVVKNTLALRSIKIDGDQLKDSNKSFVRRDGAKTLSSYKHTRSHTHAIKTTPFRVKDRSRGRAVNLLITDRHALLNGSSFLCRGKQTNMRL